MASFTKTRPLPFALKILGQEFQTALCLMFQCQNIGKDSVILCQMFFSHYSSKSLQKLILWQAKKKKLLPQILHSPGFGLGFAFSVSSPLRVIVTMYAVLLTNLDPYLQLENVQYHHLYSQFPPQLPRTQQLLLGFYYQL